MPKHDINKLSLIWDKRQKDFVVKYPRPCDGALIMHRLVDDNLIFSTKKWIDKKVVPYDIENLKKELEKRGYDLTTLRFEIKLKK